MRQTFPHISSTGPKCRIIIKTMHLTQTVSKNAKAYANYANIIFRPLLLHCFSTKKQYFYQKSFLPVSCFNVFPKMEHGSAFFLLLLLLLFWLK